jgi:four helix bundle protein
VNGKENQLVDCTFELAVQIIEFCDVLFKMKKIEVARQLLKSGTSVGANVREAQHAESRIDFIHKLKISSKECSETEYWIALVYRSYGVKRDDLNDNLKKVGKLLSASIATAKRNLQNHRSQL